MRWRRRGKRWLWRRWQEEKGRGGEEEGKGDGEKMKKLKEEVEDEEKEEEEKKGLSTRDLRLKISPSTDKRQPDS
ncbi:hypothetical protein LSTR_LSTR012444 [Laodelphax striatellus]|uniref:Uncharacterized protein n=1 Tax=Laodelphax striatellus TaxID=195883 RepID=A0A482X466_LAOST|nr:hypothetical protein LSTR_LSTR012444 [Laodelphax striatellus]